MLSQKTIQDLQRMGIPCHVSPNPSNYKTDKLPVTFDEYPDDAPIDNFAMVPSYKRMAVCILKNDHTCKYMGFSQTKEQTAKRRCALEQYAAL